MIPAPTMQDVTGHEKNNPRRLCCILFAPPYTKVGKALVVPRANYLDRRSGVSADFYCAGYGAYWPDSLVQDIQKLEVHTYPNNVEIPWAFSQTFFADFVDALEAATRWEYSGESDLLVLGPTVDFSNCLSFNIEKALKDHAIDSPSQIFESIIRYARRNCDASVRDLSDRQGVSLLGTAAAEGILSYLPKPLQNLWTSGKHYAVRDLAVANGVE